MLLLNLEMKRNYFIQIAIGAFIYYLASGFSNNYDYFHSEENETKNFWTGYTITIALLIFIVLLIIYSN